MMKKGFALLLSVLLTVCVCFPAFAAEGDAPQPLQLRQDGTFRILHCCDIQDVYPMNPSGYAFIEETIAALQPDLVVLGGDNCVAAQADTDAAIAQICELFVNSGTRFTLVFGNHDHENGVDKETLLNLYQTYGGAYCLAYDPEPALTGVATHNLPILSSDGSGAAFNLYMFDSNTYTFDTDGKRLGYDAVHPDQIAWYRRTTATLSQQNGRKIVPALAFQHIVVQEVYDALFYKSPITADDHPDALSSLPIKRYYNMWYTYIPKIAALRSGLMLELPCPGYYNYGQLDAMQQFGDVQAVFSGHDHSNDYTVRIKGIDVINTPSCSYYVTKHNINRGIRVIDLDGNAGTYSTFVYYAAEHILKTDSRIPQLGEMSKTRAFFNILANKCLNGLVKVLQIPFFFAK